MIGRGRYTWHTVHHDNKGHKFCDFLFAFLHMKPLLKRCPLQMALRKHAYSIIPNFLPPKNENFQIKNSDIFHISAPNIDCGYPLELPRRGGSNAYPQSMFLSRNKKNNVYDVNPRFILLKWCLRGSKLYRHVFVMKKICS